MLLPHAYLWSILVKFLDLAAILFAFAVGAWLVHDSEGAEPFGRVFFFLKAGFELALYVGAWLLVTAELGIYRVERVPSATRKILVLTAVSLFCLLMASLGNRFLDARGYEFRELVVFWAIHVVFLIVTRLSLPVVLRYLRLRGMAYKNVLLVGLQDRSFGEVRRLVEGELGHRLVGYVDLGASPAKQNSGGSGLERLGSIDELRFVLSSRIIDEVVLALSGKTHFAEIEEVLNVCLEAGVAARAPVMLPVPTGIEPRIAASGTLPMLQFSRYPDRTFELLLKRSFDVAVAVVLLVLLAPIFALIVVSLLIDSSGPVFFLQERFGYHNRRFRLMKFRTMVPSAEALKGSLMSYNEMDGPVFKMRDDPRVTRVGRVLRRLSLDELPQLVNVIKGEMSLVGPRPSVPEEVEAYSWRQRRRLSVRPGITGLWQVGGRNEVSFDEWIELDLQYIDQWSLAMDFYILLRTVSAVVGGRGAM